MELCVIHIWKCSLIESKRYLLLSINSKETLLGWRQYLLWSKISPFTSSYTSCYSVCFSSHNFLVMVLAILFIVLPVMLVLCCSLCCPFRSQQTLPLLDVVRKYFAEDFDRQFNSLVTPRLIMYFLGNFRVCAKGYKYRSRSLAVGLPSFFLQHQTFFAPRLLFYSHTS